MINRRKICVITGTRAEYGLLYWTMLKLSNDANIELQLVVTGMHLSPEFGLTYKQIEQDGFLIKKKVELLLSSDTSVGITKSVGLGVICFAEVFDDLKPDLILVLGDRFEILAAVTAAMLARVPIAHCHGGEITEGVIDESIRHSITKMSHLHFTSTEEYKKRVIQLGEQPQNVYNVGALGIENINKLRLLNRSEFEESISFKLNKLNLLVTFHPVTLENKTAGSQFESLLKAINELQDVTIIFTKSNADADGRIINLLIDEFVATNAHKAVAFISLGQLRYLSAMQFADIIIGNSSSGIIEAPSFKKATINIGDRQAGRISAPSVINCSPNYLSIKNALQQAFSPEFKTMLTTVTNPYGNGNSSEAIVAVLKERDISKIIRKKFYDIN